MNIRLLLATPDAASLRLFETVLASALELTPLDVTTAHAGSLSALHARLDRALDDVVMLDWLVAQEQTPMLVRELLAKNPRLRIVAVLPLGLRQYRRQVWEAGACAGIAKESMEQEWFSSVLCIMHRAMEREARLLATLMPSRAEWEAAPVEAPERTGERMNTAVSEEVSEEVTEEVTEVGNRTVAVEL